jgi:hypothetical protein
MRTDELRFTAAQTMNLCRAQSSRDVSFVLCAWLGPKQCAWRETAARYVHAGQFGLVILAEVEVGTKARVR